MRRLLTLALFALLFVGCSASLSFTPKAKLTEQYNHQVSGKHLRVYYTAVQEESGTVLKMAVRNVADAFMRSLLVSVEPSGVSEVRKESVNFGSLKVHSSKPAAVKLPKGFGGKVTLHYEFIPVAEMSSGQDYDAVEPIRGIIILDVAK